MPATFQSATFSPASPFKAGDIITFTVTFDELVNATGAALTLTGDPARTTSSVTGVILTNTLEFTYTVQPGDNVADLEITGFTGLIEDSVEFVLVSQFATTTLDITLDTTARQQTHLFR